MADPTLTRTIMRTMLTQLTAAVPTTPGPLEIGKAHLFVTNMSLSPDTLLTDFTEATFDGYAAVSITWGTAYSDSDGNAHIPGGLLEFLCTGSTTPNTVYGVYVTNTGGTVLLWSYLLASPANITTSGDAVLTTPELVIKDPSA